MCLSPSPEFGAQTCGLWLQGQQWGVSPATAEPPTRPPTIFGTWTGSPILSSAPLWCWLAGVCTCSYAPPPPKDQDDPRHGERKPGGPPPHNPEPWLSEKSTLILRSTGSAGAERVGSVAQSCPTLCNHIDCSKNTGVGYHFLLQGIFQTQGSSTYISWVFHIGRWLFTPVPPGKPQGFKAEVSIISYPCEDPFAGSLGFLPSGWELPRGPRSILAEKLLVDLTHLESQVQQRDRQGINKAAQWTFWTKIMKGRKIVFSRHRSPFSATCNADSSHPTSGNEPLSGKKGGISLPRRVAYSSGVSVQGRLFLSFWQAAGLWDTWHDSCIFVSPQAQQLYNQQIPRITQILPVNLERSWNRFVNDVAQVERGKWRHRE